jgi:POT family proton-dependent oligopeptide transporter
MVPAAKLTADGKVGPMWLVALFFLQTVGEMLLSPVGLSTMTKLAPQRLVGLVMGIWFLAAALGNKLAGVLAGEFKSENANELANFLPPPSPHRRRLHRSSSSPSSPGSKNSWAA